MWYCNLHLPPPLGILVVVAAAQLLTSSAAVGNSNIIDVHNAKELSSFAWGYAGDSSSDPFLDKTDGNNSSQQQRWQNQRGRHLSSSFNDYADPTFECPATTTCRVVCVAAAEDCPEDAQCPNNDGSNYQLCNDGTCANVNANEACNNNNNDEEMASSSPCKCSSLPIACAKQIDYYDRCLESFQSYYETENECITQEKEKANAQHSVDFNGPVFITGYVSLGLLTICMLLWCAWNQKLSRVPNSTLYLECATAATKKKNRTKGGRVQRGGNAAGDNNITHGAVRRASTFSSNSQDEGMVMTTRTAGGCNQWVDEEMTVGLNADNNYTDNCVGSGMEEIWTQTGYKDTFVGMLLYGLVILAQVTIQFLLLALTVEYYVQQGAIKFSFFGRQVYYDELQVLMAFEIVWMIGIAWCFFLKYPTSIHSIFLRRCTPEEATYIAVSAPVQSVDPHYETMWITKLLSLVGNAFHSVLEFLYSDESSQQGTRKKVTFCKVRQDVKTDSRYFYFRMRRYILHHDSKKFIPGCWDVTQDATIGKWLDATFIYQGLNAEEASKRLQIVGPNVLDLKRPTFFGSIANEFSKPFYLYQNFMVWTWAPFWYYYMAIVNTVVRVTGGLVVAIFQYFSDKSFYELMMMNGTAEVLRGGEMILINQTDVVPGDIVRLKPGLAYFDMALLQSNHLLVDESSLTGEVNPIAKLPLDASKNTYAYDAETDKVSTISAGTTILECGEEEGALGDLAIVTQTGSFTAKGELLCDVLSYERHKFKFDTEVKLVLGILAVEGIALVTMVFSFIESDNWVYSWFYAMFVVGAVLPPLLPTVFVVSVGISCKRLQDIRITCSDSQGILVAGKVKKCFFDKTGTLTKQGLDFVAAHTGDEQEKESPVLRRGLAVCHTLHLSQTTGELIGSAVDLNMVDAVKSVTQFTQENTIIYEGEQIEYLKRFEFDHHSMLQSVVIRHRNEDVVYVKGSPEAVGNICSPSSLPSNFVESTREAARTGIYQLAIATSTFVIDEMNASEIKRDDIEKNVEFCGFVNFQNYMREETPGVISELREGNVDCTMITGDNTLTGVHIAKIAGIIEPGKNVVIGNMIGPDGQIEWVNSSDEQPISGPSVSSLGDFTIFNSLALTGEVWRYLLDHNPQSALEYAKHTRVFGRCTPNDKVSIVSTFVEIGLITLMCGDGGNDCGALKAAHVGIALSDSEASVVAPFTSLDKSITSVTDVLREGRCALASALASYKYMIMYGQVSCINQVINAYFHVTFSEWCWLFIDGIWSITMAFSLPLARAATKLSSKRPTASLLGLHTLSSSCGILAINFVFIIFGLLALFHQDWFQCRKWQSKDVSNVVSMGDNYESSVIFIISGYQYISSAAAYNFGYSYRANWLRNHIFVFLFLLWTGFQFGATLSSSSFSCIWRLNCDNDHVVRSVTTEPSPIHNNFNTTVMPLGFRGVLVTLMIINLIVICAWDYFVVNMSIHRSPKQIGMVQEGHQHAQNEDDEYEPPTIL